MRTLKMVAALLTPFMLFTGTAVAQVAPEADEPKPSIGLPVDLRIPLAPAPLTANGGTHLVYELHLSNLSGMTFELGKLEIRDAAKSAALLAYDSAALAAITEVPGASEEMGTITLTGGGTAILFIDYLLKPGSKAPAQLSHRAHFVLRRPDGSARTRYVDGAPVAVSAAKPLVLHPPLRGAGWVAADTLDNAPGSHRRTLMPVNGSARIAQRYATDWVQLGTDGLMYRGDGTRNENWSGFGADVLAVADATVSAIEDGHPDNAAGTAPEGVSLETIAGNFVILDLGRQRFALYAHLRPGSLKVKVGDKVKTGQLLAKLGNTGNSDGPHLHFQVMNANSPLAAEGLPYVFDRYSQRGTVQTPATMLDGSQAWTADPKTPAVTRRNELPGNYAVVDFK